MSNEKTVLSRNALNSEHSFTLQAPASMKSVLQSFWLLTVAFGDLIVIVLTSVKPVKGVVRYIYYTLRADSNSNERQESRYNTRARARLEGHATRGICRLSRVCV